MGLWEIVFVNIIIYYVLYNIVLFFVLFCFVLFFIYNSFLSNWSVQKILLSEVWSHCVILVGGALNILENMMDQSPRSSLVSLITHSVTC